MKMTPMKNMHLLSELVDLVTTHYRRAAMEKYLTCDDHKEMLIVGSFIEQCRESQRNLLKGDISPHLDVCCCADTFTAALTCTPSIVYKSCALPEEEGYDDVANPDDIPTLNQVIRHDVFVQLSKLPVEKLRKTLIHRYFCSDAEYGQVHEADEKIQRQYYDAVFRRFEAAAQYAKAIGSESARLWLEAICLISPRAYLKNSARVIVGLDLDPDCVVQAYEVAERAQRTLWVDNRLRTLPAAKLPRKTSKKHR